MYFQFDPGWNAYRRCIRFICGGVNGEGEERASCECDLARVGAVEGTRAGSNLLSDGEGGAGAHGSNRFKLKK